MENKQFKSYRTEPTFHRVNVFHIYSTYRFLNFSCEICKFSDVCHNIKHKREICIVAQSTARYFNNFIRASVSSFSSDDFFICGKHERSEIYIKKTVERILKKYSKENVRS